MLKLGGTAVIILGQIGWFLLAGGSELAITCTTTRHKMMLSGMVNPIWEEHYLIPYLVGIPESHLQQPKYSGHDMMAAHKTLIRNGSAVSNLLKTTDQVRTAVVHVLCFLVIITVISQLNSLVIPSTTFWTSHWCPQIRTRSWGMKNIPIPRFNRHISASNSCINYDKQAARSAIRRRRLYYDTRYVLPWYVSRWRDQWWNTATATHSSL